MTYAQMGCNPEETARRQGVVAKMNLLYDKSNATEDEKKRKRYKHSLDVIRRRESWWLREIAFFLY